MTHHHPRRSRLPLVVIVTLLALLVVGIASATAARATGGGHYPVTICHNGHTITIDKSALPAHLAHGDAVGECTEPEPTPTDEPTVEPTPTPTETVEPTPEPTEPEPTTEPTVTPTTPVVTPEPPAVTPAALPVPGPPAPVAEVGTVDTLAATGVSLEGVALAVGLVGVGVLLYAASRRPGRDPNPRHARR